MCAVKVSTQTIGARTYEVYATNLAEWQNGMQSHRTSCHKSGLHSDKVVIMAVLSADAQNDGHQQRIDNRQITDSASLLRINNLQICPDIDSAALNFPQRGLMELRCIFRSPVTRAAVHFLEHLSDAAKSAHADLTKLVARIAYPVGTEDVRMHICESGVDGD